MSVDNIWSCLIMCECEIPLTVAQGRSEATAKQALLLSTTDDVTVTAYCNLLHNREKQRKW